MHLSAAAALTFLLVLSAQPRRAFACCANQADYIRVTRVFAIPDTDCFLVEQASYLDTLANGIGPEWKTSDAPVPPSIDDRRVFDYMIYDSALRPLAGVLSDLARDYDTGRAFFKEVYAKLGELPKPVEDKLQAYQAALNARGAKVKKKTIKLETFLGAVPLSRSTTCGFQGRVKGSSLTVLYTDKLTQNQLPVAEFSVQFPCHDGPTDTEISTQVESVRCYDDPSLERTVVVVGDHCNGWCGGMHTDHVVGFSPNKLTSMRENILGFRAAKDHDYTAAREHLGKSLQLSPDYSHANFNMACTLSRLGQDWTQAKELLERLLSKNDLRKIYQDKINSDSDLEAWRKNTAFVAWVSATAARYEEAAKAAKVRAASASEAEAQRLNREGMRLYRQKDLFAAAVKFEMAANLDPASLTASTNAASVYALMGQHGDAIRRLKAAMKLSKKRTQERIRADHDYDSMRDSPALQELLAQ